MPANRLKLLIVPFVLLWISACVNTGGLTPDTSERNRMLSIVLDERLLEIFFQRIEIFAHHHNFEMQPSEMEMILIGSQVSLVGDDKIFVLVEPLTLNYDVSPRPIMIYFMGGDAENPTDAATKKKIDEQVSALINLISGIPTIKITDVSCKQPDDKDWQRCLDDAFRNDMDRYALGLLLFTILIFGLVAINRRMPPSKRIKLPLPLFKDKTMNTNQLTKPNEKVDVALIALPVALVEAALIVIATQLAAGGFAAVVSSMAVVPLMVGAFVGGALGKRAGGDWKDVAIAAVVGSLLTLALGVGCLVAGN